MLARMARSKRTTASHAHPSAHGSPRVQDGLASSVPRSSESAAARKATEQCFSRRGATKWLRPLLQSPSAQRRVKGSVGGRGGGKILWAANGARTPVAADGHLQQPSHTEAYCVTTPPCPEASITPKWAFAPTSAPPPGGRVGGMCIAIGPNIAQIRPTHGGT